MDIQVREAVEADIESIKNRLRRLDAEETIASGYKSPEECLRGSFSRSSMRYCVVLEGTPVALFGIVPDTLLGPSANIWFLGADGMSRIRKSFVKQSRLVIREWLKRYPILWNYIDARYRSSLVWIRSCGAEFGPEFKIQDHPFIPFVIRRA